MTLDEKQTVAKYPLMLFDREMVIEIDAFNALPKEAQEFIKHVLKRQWACIKSWGWVEIEWMFKNKNKRWVKLCSNGSPARDIGFVWVYNVDSNRYELHETQYHSPISLRKNQAPDRTTDSLDELLSSLDFPKY
jgi:hypothetical protein